MNGGPNEYVRHGIDGLKIYANQDSVAWGLGNLMADWPAARKMGEEGKRSVARSFTWEVIAEKTLDVYYSLPGVSRPEVLPLEHEEDPAPTPEARASEVAERTKARHQRRGSKKRPRAVASRG